MSFLNPLTPVIVGIQVSGVVGTSGIVNVASGIINVASGTVGVSGLFAGMSGATPFLSGAAGFSGAMPTIPLVFDFSGKQWTQWSTAISGSTVPAVWVASGNITTAVTTNISGQVVYFSPTTASGNNYVLEVGNKVMFSTASGVGLGSNASGGMTLASCGPLISVTIRNQSGNGAVMIGGAAGTSGTAAAAAGIELFANETLTLKINNSNLASVFNETAGTSGQKVWYVGVQQI